MAAQETVNFYNWDLRPETKSQTFVDDVAFALASMIDNLLSIETL